MTDDMLTGSAALLRDDHRKYHSPFQVAEFILEESSGGTAYGFYRQCLREMSTRRQGLRAALIVLSKTQRRIDELEACAGQRDLFGDLANPEAVEDLLEARAQREDLGLTLKEHWRELHLFYSHAQAVRALLPDELDEHRRHNLDREMWLDTARRRVYTERTANGRVSEATIKMLMHFEPREQKLALEGSTGYRRFKPPSVNVEPPPLPAPVELAKQLRCSHLSHLLTR